MVTPISIGQDPSGRIAAFPPQAHPDPHDLPPGGLFGAEGLAEAPFVGFPAKRREPKKTFSLMRLWRRRQRLRRDALEEAQHLRRWHGEFALAVAQEKLARPGRTAWGRAVLTDAIKLLQTQRI